MYHFHGLFNQSLWIPNVCSMATFNPERIVVLLWVFRIAFPSNDTLHRASDPPPTSQYDEVKGSSSSEFQLPTQPSHPSLTVSSTSAIPLLGVTPFPDGARQAFRQHPHVSLVGVSRLTPALVEAKHLSPLESVTRLAAMSILPLTSLVRRAAIISLSCD